jgi:hypothetical protein
LQETLPPGRRHYDRASGQAFDPAKAEHARLKGRAQAAREVGPPLTPI